MEIKVILGLGNPGHEYEETNHNLGILFVNYLMDQFGSEPAKDGKTYAAFKTKINNKDILIIKPKVFMNNSAEALIPVIKKSNWKLSEVMIVHDDSDIEFGHFKHSFGASSAGHRGVQSIIEALGTNEFHRLRIGIRKKPGKALNFVLKKITKSDFSVYEKVFAEIRQLLEKYLK